MNVEISLLVTQESYNSVRHTLQNGSSYVSVGSPSLLVKEVRRTVYHTFYLTRLILLLVSIYAYVERYIQENSALIITMKVMETVERHYSAFNTKNVQKTRLSQIAHHSSCCLLYLHYDTVYLWSVLLMECITNILRSCY